MYVQVFLYTHTHIRNKKHIGIDHIAVIRHFHFAIFQINKSQRYVCKTNFHVIDIDHCLLSKRKIEYGYSEKKVIEQKKERERARF
jgi:hypothetical protein